MRTAIVVAVALALSASAAAGTTHSQGFTLYTANLHGRNVPVVVRASGAVNAVGTETQTENETRSGQLNRVVLHFAGGTIRLVAPERFAWNPDVRSCSATATGGGTFTITGGTGAFRGATGKGTFTSDGVALGAHSSSGACLAKAMPVANYVIVTLKGTIAVP